MRRVCSGKPLRMRLERLALDFPLAGEGRGEGSERSECF